MELGCTVMEADSDKEPTGRWLVLKQEAADRCFPTAVGKKKVLVDMELFQLLQQQAEENSDDRMDT